jgi:hypothetical protein
VTQTRYVLSDAQQAPTQRRELWHPFPAWQTASASTIRWRQAWQPHPPPAAYAKKFTGKYQHRTLTGGIGHNLPQEAPREFARAILDVAAFQ